MQFILPVVVGILAVWIIVLTYFEVKIYRHYTRLTKDSSGANLMSILEKIMSSQKTNVEDIHAVGKDIKEVRVKMKTTVQKVGVVKFNPFAETGGEQSFAVSLLDGMDDGLVLTGLHSRDRTRLYIKPIVRGKSDLELSKEEVRAVTAAKKK